MGAAPAREIMPQARAAATQAVRMDDSLGEAYVALGTIAMSFDWDGPSAEHDFKRGIELNPNNSEAHQFYALYLEASGRLDDAIREAEQARQLDPLSLFINRDFGRAFYYAHQYDKAIDVFRQTIELDPNYPVVYNWLGPLYEKKGMTDEAIAAYLKQDGLEGASPDAIRALHTAYASSGLRGYWRKLREILKDEPNTSYQTAYDMALVYAHLGNKDQALRYLNDLYDSRSFWVVWLNVDPVFDNLRSDPRLQDLIRRVGLAR
jgi:tetratricopeptide (TPR) repeat protein